MVNRLNKLEAGYIAGIADGEGHFDLMKRPTSNKLKYNYCPRFRVAQVDKRLCDWLLKVIGGGTINKREKKHINPKWQDVYIYELAGWHNCLKLVLQIHPLLIVKREQVEKVFGNKLSWKYMRLLSIYNSGADKRWTKYLAKTPQVPWNKGKKYTDKQKENVTLGIKKYWSGLYKEPRSYGKRI